MTILIPPGFAAFSEEIIHAGSGRSAFITGGVDVTSFSGDFEEAANAVHGAFGSWQPNLTSNASFIAAHLRVGQDGGDPVVVDSTDAPIAGTLAGAVQSANCAVLVTKQTALGGRKGRGRWFVPWAVTENNVDPLGVIDAEHVAGLATAASNTLASFTSNGCPLVLLHADVVGAPAPTLVTSLSVSALIGSQRRRLGR
jgi:hypothetical protein